MADLDKFVTNLDTSASVDQQVGDVSELVAKVNKTFAHGYWDGRAELEAGEVVDNMSGKEIKMARDLMRKEVKRLADMRKALTNTLEFIDKRIAHTPDTFDDFS